MATLRALTGEATTQGIDGTAIASVQGEITGGNYKGYINIFMRLLSLPHKAV
jgi:hypothetical protein